MSIDLSQFFEVFFEESFEGLDTMEAELLNLEPGEEDLETINTIFRIIFFALIGSVILSWVSPGNGHPFFQLVEEISSKALEPIRRFIPAFGGLDFSPLVALILIRQIEILLASFLRFII